MKDSVLLSTCVLALLLFSCVQPWPAAADTNAGKDRTEEEIWAREEAYFSNLYKANYEGMLSHVHNQFLGWPSAALQPIDKEGSAHFMKQLAPKPTGCTFTIERAGIRLMREVALTHYIIRVHCGDADGKAKADVSRITHTWVKEGSHWSLLGGMSYDQ